MQNLERLLTVRAIEMCAKTSSAKSIHRYLWQLSPVSYNPQHVCHGGKTFSTNVTSIFAAWVKDDLFLIAFHSSFFGGGGRRDAKTKIENERPRRM